MHDDLHSPSEKETEPQLSQAIYNTTVVYISTYHEGSHTVFEWDASLCKLHVFYHGATVPVGRTLI